jgi:hypothetical protein
MRQLTSGDTPFLALENSRHIRHVAGLAILDSRSTAASRPIAASLELDELEPPPGW